MWYLDLLIANRIRAGKYDPIEIQRTALRLGYSQSEIDESLKKTRVHMGRCDANAIRRSSRIGRNRKPNKHG